MKFKLWLQPNEKTLYHGTVIDNLDQIKKYGLTGRAGDFVKSSYDELPEDEFPQIVFATDKQDLSKAVTAMVHHIGNKLGKNFHDVNDNDILNHGLIAIIKDGEQYSTQRTDDYDDYQHPYTVEPGDYYSDHLPTHGFLKGQVLLRILRRMGEWPRTWGDTSPSLNKIKGELIRLAIAKHPKQNKETIIQKVNSLTPQKAKEFLAMYRRNSQ